MGADAKPRAPEVPLRFTTLLILIALVATPALAKPNNPDITLEFSPTVAAGDVASPMIPAGTAIAIEVQDVRRNTEPDYLGTRTDDDDANFTLRATNDVIAFVNQALRATAASWNVPVQDDAAHRLIVELDMFRVHESNQVVGASYESEVRLVGRMQLPDGTTAEVIKVGDATRYGKKFSNQNCNEVLSDALRESFASLLDDSRLWKAQAGAAVAEATTPSGATGSRAEPLSPDTLLEQLLELRAEGFGDATITTFVSRQTLTRALSAADLRKWKEQGVKEVWMQRAMELPIR
jgi:uncharacterized lipoprotein YajG